MAPLCNVVNVARDNLPDHFQNFWFKNTGFKIQYFHFELGVLHLAGLNKKYH